MIGSYEITDLVASSQTNLVPLAFVYIALRRWSLRVIELVVIAVLLMNHYLPL